ncbi:MAG: hypothetical protein U0Q16_24755 [Bryobacteraceae bacterium]
MRIAVAFLVLALGVGPIGLVALKHRQFWERIPHASVAIDGKREAVPRAYRNGPDAILICLNEDTGDYYVVRLTEHEIGVTGPHYFWLVWENVAISKDRPDPSINISSGKCDNHQAMLVDDSRKASFVALSGAKVEVTW